MLVQSIISINVRIGPPLTVHDALIIAPPAPPLPAKLPHVELPHTLMWGFGRDFTNTVQFDRFTVAHQGNDAGIGIIHISIPINNALLPLTIATSSFKCLFGASTVLVEKKPAAGFFPPLAMELACNWPVPLPLGVHVPFPNTVWVGMTFLDFLFGWAMVAASMAVDAILNKFGARLGQEAFGKMFGNLAGRLGMQALARTLFEKIGEEVFKGLVVSPLMEGKIQLPFQLGELNLWTGETKFLHMEGPRVYRGADQAYGSVMGAANWGQSASQAPSNQSANPANSASSGLPTVP